MGCAIDVSLSVSSPVILLHLEVGVLPDQLLELVQEERKLLLYEDNTGELELLEGTPERNTCADLSILIWLSMEPS